MHRLLFAGFLAFAFIMAGCAVNLTGPDQTRTRVENKLDGLSKGLESGTWEQVEDFFSSGYYGGTEQLRNKVERRMRNEDLSDLDFTINKVLETDEMISVDVSWKKTWVNRKGAPFRQDGRSEILLKPTRRGYKIVDVKGDSFY